MTDYLELRSHFFQEIQARPENYTLIAHNCASAMSKLGVTPAISEATLRELQRRWELALLSRHFGKS